MYCCVVPKTIQKWMAVAGRPEHTIIHHPVFVPASGAAASICTHMLINKYDRTVRLHRARTYYVYCVRARTMFARTPGEVNGVISGSVCVFVCEVVRNRCLNQRARADAHCSRVSPQLLLPYYSRI